MAVHFCLLAFTVHVILRLLSSQLLVAFNCVNDADVMVSLTINGANGCDAMVLLTFNGAIDGYAIVLLTFNGANDGDAMVFLVLLHCFLFCH